MRRERVLEILQAGGYIIQTKATNGFDETVEMYTLYSASHTPLRPVLNQVVQDLEREGRVSRHITNGQAQIIRLQARE